MAKAIRCKLDLWDAERELELAAGVDELDDLSGLTDSVCAGLDYPADDELLKVAEDVWNENYAAVTAGSETKA